MGINSNLKAQAGGNVCPPGSCPPCATTSFSSSPLLPPGCQLYWYWRYGGTPNCGDVFAWTNTLPSASLTGPCMRCTDSDPCRCPEYIYLTDGINTLFISNIASLTGIGPYPFTFTYPASSINCGNFIITITVNGPNNFSISTAP
jgi:hypothetical protein